MNDFAHIDARRAENGITRKALYERAEVDKETWRRTVKGRTSPNTRTLEKLKKALDALISERGEANGRSTD